MGENKSQKNGRGEKKNTGEIVQKKDPVGGNKKDGNLTAVLKSDFHYDGCVTKDVKAIRIVGVEVSGKVDPVILRQIVEQKTPKRVEFISPVPIKDGKGKGDAGAADGDKKQPPITTAVLKVYLHCQGCIQDFRKVVTEFKGYKDMRIDMEKHLVTVTGSMNMKDLVEKLKKDLKKEVEIVPLKKEGGDKKEKAKGNGEGKGKGKA